MRLFTVPEPALCAGYTLAIVLAASALAGCSGEEDRKAAHRERARVLYENGELEKARLELKNVLQIDPADVDAGYRLARILEQQKNWQGAAAHYRRVLEQQPTHEGAAVRLGQLYLLSDRVEEARKLAAKVLEAQPDSAEALALMAAVKVRSGDPEAGGADARRALEIEPGNRNAVSVLASIHIQANELERAVAVLDAGIAKNRDNAGLRILLARVRSAQGNHEAAAALLREVVERQPENLGYRLELARLYAYLGRRADGEKLLREGLAYEREDAGARLALIEYLVTGGEKERATAELRHFVEAAPESVAMRFALARIRAQEGDVAAASAQYQQIIERRAWSEDGVRARNELATLYASTQDLDKAEELVAAVLEEHPRERDALMLSGRIALARNDSESALRHFRTLLRHHPYDVEGLRFSARAYLAREEFDRARDYLQRAVTADPANPDVRWDLAKLLIQLGDQAPAIDELERLVSIKPDHAIALNALGRLQISTRDWAGARDTARKLQAQHPDAADGYLLLGLVEQQQKGDSAAGVASLEAALEREPKNAEALSALVRNLLASGKAAEAMQRVDAILARFGDDEASLNLKGEIHLREQEPVKAEQAFVKAMALRPAWGVPYRNAAAARLAAGDPEGAMSYYRKGLEATDGAPALVFELASRYEALGNYDLAIEQYESLLQRNPLLHAAVNNLAMLLVNYRSDEASLARAGELTQRFERSSNPDYLDTLGWVHYKRGELAEAVKTLTRAVRLAPRVPTYHYHLAQVYLAQKEPGLARRHLEEALGAKVDFREIELARSALRELGEGG